MNCPICSKSCKSGISLNNGTIAHQACFERLQSKYESTSQEKFLLERKVIELQVQLEKSKTIMQAINRFFSGGVSPDSIQNDLNKTMIALKEVKKIAEKVSETCKPIFDLMLEYPPDWEDRKQAVRERDNECVKCGYGRHLDVHHKIPLSKGGCNQLDNLTLLCEWCHSKIHGNKSFKYSDSKNNLAISKRIKIIQQAISSNSNIEFLYKKFEEKSYQKRKIRPIAMKEYRHYSSEDGKTLCVEGYCYKRKADRSFAVKRMRGVKLI